MGLKETKKGPEKARKGRKESLDKVENSEKVPRNKTLNEADICDTYSMAEWQNVIRWQNGRMAECHQALSHEHGKLQCMEGIMARAGALRVSARP